MMDLMMFNDFDEFIQRRRTLRVYYIFLTYEEKRAYKKYIYAFPYRESVKDVMWCYLNEPSDEWGYQMEMVELERLYARNKNYIRI
jgi:hypothetical protein